MNCSQIFCTFAVETTGWRQRYPPSWLWIALKFFVLLQSKQPYNTNPKSVSVVNCSQIFCTFAVETTYHDFVGSPLRCELLSNFLYFCSRNNNSQSPLLTVHVVNCSQIFCTFAVETTILLFFCSILWLWIALKFFVLLQSKQHWF